MDYPTRSEPGRRHAVAGLRRGGSGGREGNAKQALSPDPRVGARAARATVVFTARPGAGCGVRSVRGQVACFPRQLVPAGTRPCETRAGGNAEPIRCSAPQHHGSGVVRRQSTGPRHAPPRAAHGASNPLVEDLVRGLRASHPRAAGSSPLARRFQSRPRHRDHHDQSLAARVRHGNQRAVRSGRVDERHPRFMFRYLRWAL